MMDPDRGTFEKFDTEEMLYQKAPEYREKWERHSIKRDQIFKVGEIVELKGAKYRIKNIHTKSIVLTPEYP